LKDSWFGFKVALVEALDTKAKPRILVIDDEPEIRSLLKRVLNSAGYEVALATDGKQAVDRFRDDPANLVLTDLFMPHQEGLETIMQLRKEFPQVAIIAMSGKTAGSAMLPIAQKLGAAAILEKPFAPQQLLDAVALALRS
jgi:DNA-binding response OmpR family regulator